MDRYRDPLELWVGTWTPKEMAEREGRKIEEPRPEPEDRAPSADAPPSA